MRKTESKKQEEQTIPEADALKTEMQTVAEAAPAKKPTKELKPLKGFRRELTKELFEELGALQCPVKEILGYVGTDEVALGKWIHRTYGPRHTLDEILRMVKQDGLIAIRRASFDQLKRAPRSSPSSTTASSRTPERTIPKPAWLPSTPLRNSFQRLVRKRWRNCLTNNSFKKQYNNRYRRPKGVWGAIGKPPILKQIIGGIE